MAALLMLVLALPGTVLAASPGELRVALPWTPENLDPTMNLSSIRSQVGVSLFDSLVGRDADGKIVPELAESWRLIDDRTWQFRLRKGVVFHNGEPFNAEAVRFTFQRVLNPEQKSPNRANVAEIVQIDVVDESTITGEAMPVEKAAGGTVTGGTMNGHGSFTMRAERVGADTLLARIVRVVSEAQRSRAPVPRLADVVSAWFVPSGGASGQQ